MPQKNQEVVTSNKHTIFFEKSFRFISRTLDTLPYSIPPGEAKKIELIRNQEMSPDKSFEK